MIGPHQLGPPLEGRVRPLPARLCSSHGRCSRLFRDERQRVCCWSCTFLFCGHCCWCQCHRPCRWAAPCWRSHCGWRPVFYGETGSLEHTGSRRWEPTPFRVLSFALRYHQKSQLSISLSLEHTFPLTPQLCALLLASWVPYQSLNSDPPKYFHTPTPIPVSVA